MPAPRAVCRWRFIGSSERTEPIAPDQSARRNGNSHRTLIAPAIGATAIADCLLPANWPRNCEYGPIFDPLRPDLKERLRSAPPHFGSTSHATSLREVLNEEADSINRFRRLHCYAHQSGYQLRRRSKMQCRDAIKSARVLVLASDGRKCWYEGKPMLSKSFVGVACAGFSTTEFR